ncbi:NAD(P)-dependent oxidoreductase [Martelella lutilitoris]|uniref:NAD(P)-dependent oxidoreductase n=1 Tax=Martelella lutilitoris TaxID=2583532 RepID=A0A5C4JNZ9_9HYPH|nr:NAD(P)-dependent oxidoreductase [Martelella lutilitoris]TNB47166.1 NAD(P)-dependent oxidoreductase [Martelella lutilitoris]
MNKKNVLVFGGSGFIGSHLIRALSEQADSNIYSVDIRQPKVKTEGVTYITGDVRDLSGFEFDQDADVIYNFAAVHTTPGHETHEYYETNIRGATEVTAFARRKNCRTIVFTSSISVYGPSEEAKTEESAPAPESAYGWSKWLSEGIHRAWLEENEQHRLVIVRPAVIFGHREGGNFTRLAKLLKKGFFVYPGRKDTIKACYYVEDLLSSVNYALSLNERYVLFNGCYPERYTLEQIVETFKTVEFHDARTFLLPRFVVSMVAMGLKPFSTMGLGVHPDRVTKLVRSTDIIPGWLEAQGQAKPDMLASALKRWKSDSRGSFE